SRVPARSSSCGQEGRPVGHGDPAQADDGGVGVPSADRCLVDARGLHSRHASCRLRRAGGNDYALACRTRSDGVRPRCADGGEVDTRQTGLVHDERCARRQQGLGAPSPYGAQQGRTQMRTPFTGVGTALVSPFTRSGSLDEAAVRRLARRQIDAGVHFLCPCGTTGESPTLTDAERLRTVEIVADEANGRVPVLAGAGGYDTKEVLHLASEMQKAGASGLLSVTPYYNKPTQEGLYQHYRAIAEHTALPIIVYNVPGRTGVNVEAATLVRLAAVPHIVGVKEASGNVTQMCEICRVVPPDFLVLSGDDALTLPLMAVGGRGIISVAGN